MYRALLVRQRSGTEVCELRHADAYRSVAHLLGENGLPAASRSRQYAGALRRLKSVIDLGADASVKTMIHLRLMDHLKKHRRAGRTDLTIGYAGGSRDANCERVFGYTLTDLMKHLESGFSEGMTWARVSTGDVQLDHILPSRAFDLSTEAGVYRAYGLDNLQPLWRGDNARKGRTTDLDFLKLFGEGTICG